MKTDLKASIVLRSFLALSLAFFFCAGVQAQLQPTPRTPAISAERISRLGKLLDDYAAAKKLPGGVVMVSQNGKPVYTHAFGKRDIEANEAMPSNAIFRIASQTKAVVSAAILILQEEGKLLISDPAGKYIPEFMNTTVAVPKTDGGYDIVKAKRPITIRDLLTHTSGYGYGTGVAKDKWEAAGITGWYFADRDEPIAATVARMASLPADAQPGEKYVYGYSTDILGVIVEKASGMPLDRFLQIKILDPLAMKDTHFYLPIEKSARLTAVYSARPDGSGLDRAPESGGSLSQGSYMKGPRKSFSGGAGLLSTAGDYTRFLQMTLNGGELDGNRILGRKSIELMTADHLGTVAFRPGQGFGLGFSIVKDLGARGEIGSVGEYGWGGAYHSSYWADPKEQLVVVYLTQTLPAGTVDDFGKMRSIIYQAME